LDLYAGNFTRNRVLYKAENCTKLRKMTFPSFSFVLFSKLNQDLAFACWKYKSYIQHTPCSVTGTGIIKF